MLDCLTKMLSSEFLLPQGVWDVMCVLVYFSLEACVHLLNVSFHKLINEQKNADLKSIQKLFYWGWGGVELIKTRRGQSRLSMQKKLKT